jgi:hypothetical protein
MVVVEVQQRAGASLLILSPTPSFSSHSLPALGFYCREGLLPNSSAFFVLLGGALAGGASAKDEAIGFFASKSKMPSLLTKSA